MLIFTTCNFSFKSLAVGPAEMEGFSRITTVVPGTDDTINKLVNQFRKLVDIHEVIVIYSAEKIPRKIIVL